MRQRPKSSRRRRTFTGIALIGMLGRRRRVREHPELDRRPGRTPRRRRQDPDRVGAHEAGKVTTTVNVTLGDTNGAGPMTLDVSPATAPAGDVTFVVKNAGTIVHEAVVLKTNIPFDKTPHHLRRRPTRPRHNRRRQSQRRHQHRRNRRPRPRTRRHPHLHHQEHDRRPTTPSSATSPATTAKACAPPSPSPAPPRP